MLRTKERAKIVAAVSRTRGVHRYKSRNIPLTRDKQTHIGQVRSSVGLNPYTKPFWGSALWSEGCVTSKLVQPRTGQDCRPCVAVCTSEGITKGHLNAAFRDSYHRAAGILHPWPPASLMAGYRQIVIVQDGRAILALWISVPYVQLPTTMQDAS